MRTVPGMPAQADDTSETVDSAWTPPELTASEPEAQEPSEEHVRAALAASSRAEASLSALHRAIQLVTANASGAREANSQLNQELARVREMLGSSNEERLALKNRVELLERALVEARDQADAERRYIIDDQDRFLAGLLDEHEQTLERVVREREALRAQLEQMARRDAAEERRSNLTPPDRPITDAAQELVEARHVIEKLTTERDRSREVLRRLQAQRDDAQAQLSRLLRENADLIQELETLREPVHTPRDAKRTLPAHPAAAQPVQPMVSELELDPGDRPTVEAGVTQRSTQPRPGASWSGQSLPRGRRHLETRWKPWSHRPSRPRYPASRIPSRDRWVDMR